MKLTKYTTMRLAVWSVFTACLLSSTPAMAQEGDGRLATTLDVLAESMAKYLTKDRQDDRIFMGTFVGEPPELKRSSGALIQKMLMDKLKALNVENTRRASLSCTGAYTITDDADVFITCKIRDRRGEVLKVFDNKIPKVDNLEDLISLSGLQGDLSVDSNQQRVADTVSAVKEPAIALETADANTATASGVAAKPTIVKTTKASPFGMEVLVKTAGGGYEPRALSIEDGLTFVDMNAAEIYAIKLINRTERLAGVTLTIDGLNLFAFSENVGYRTLGRIVIPPGAHLIRGWHINNLQADEFLLVENDKVLHNDAVGTITASFATAFGPNENPRQFEKIASRGAFRTDRGPRVGQKLRETIVRFGNVQTVLSIRYNRPLPPGLGGVAPPANPAGPPANPPAPPAGAPPVN